MMAHRLGSVLFGLLVLGLILVQVEVAGIAFTLAGLDPVTAVLVVVASLFGSVLNIPVARLPGGAGSGTGRGMVIGVNLGGVVIPLAVSAHLAVRTGAWLVVGTSVAVVAAVAHVLAQPVPRVGIVLPAVLPAVMAAIAAVVLLPAGATGAVAYTAGVVGTLVGADLTHLSTLRAAGVRAVCIGGGGTFDGIFTCGVFAVLLSQLM